MNSKIFLTTVLLFVAALFSVALCLAEAPKELDHTVRFPEGDAAWSVTFVDDSKSTANTPSSAESPTPSFRWMKKTDVVRMGNVRRDRITWSTGTTTECWWSLQPPLMLFQNAPNEAVHVRKAGNVGKMRYDASLFAWVSETTFVGMKSFKGKQCRCYETEVSIEGDKMRLNAWIDNETSRPVAYKAGTSTTVFSYDIPLPAEPLVMPPIFHEQLNRVAAFLTPPRRPVRP